MHGAHILLKKYTKIRNHVGIYVKDYVNVKNLMIWKQNKN